MTSNAPPHRLISGATTASTMTLHQLKGFIQLTQHACTHFNANYSTFSGAMPQTSSLERTYIAFPRSLQTRALLSLWLFLCYIQLT